MEERHTKNMCRNAILCVKVARPRGQNRTEGRLRVQRNGLYVYTG